MKSPKCPTCKPQRRLPQKDSQGYTKGEWKVIAKRSRDVIKKGDIAIVNEAQETICIVCQEPSTITEDIANAHLIAAAPELYEALKELVDIVNNTIEYHNKPLGMDSYTLQPARKALAKVEGKLKEATNDKERGNKGM